MQYTLGMKGKVVLGLLGLFMLAAVFGPHISFGASEDIVPDGAGSQGVTDSNCTTGTAPGNLDDDPDDGTDGNECTATSNSANHDIHLTFGTPSANPDTGTDAQTFAFRAKRNATGGGGSPTVAASLYCNGSPVTGEGGAAQTLTDNYDLYTETFTFNTTDCASDGSDVEVLLDCTPNGGGPNQRSCSYENVEWEAQSGDSTAPTPDPPYFDDPAGLPSPASASSITASSTIVTDSESPPVSYYFGVDNTLCGSDAGTGGTDSGWQTNSLYTDSGLQPNQCYGYKLKARDNATIPNATATSTTASTTYTLANTPGTPTLDNPTSSTLDITNDENNNPSANPTTEFAVYASSTDPIWTEDGRYVDTDGTPASGPVWMSDSTVDALQLTGLDPLTTYYITIKARNATSSIETASSTMTSAATIDDTAPTPDPPIFDDPSGLPSPDSASSITASSTIGTDADSPPVSYYFGNNNSLCGADAGTGGTDSGWQSSQLYTDTGLDPNQCYGYLLKLRDAASPPNETATSTTASTTYTHANIPGAPTLGSPTATTLTLTNDENNNPASNPTTLFAAQVSATSPSDPTWQDMYIDGSGDPSASAVWLADSTLDGLPVTNLNDSTTYTVQVKARNDDSIETDFGTTGQGTTDILSNTTARIIRLLGGVRLRGGVRLL